MESVEQTAKKLEQILLDILRIYNLAGLLSKRGFTERKGVLSDNIIDLARKLAAQFVQVNVQRLWYIQGRVMEFYKEKGELDLDIDVYSCRFPLQLIINHNISNLLVSQKISLPDECLKITTYNSLSQIGEEAYSAAIVYDIYLANNRVLAGLLELCKNPKYEKIFGSLCQISSELATACCCWMLDDQFLTKAFCMVQCCKFVLQHNVDIAHEKLTKAITAKNSYCCLDLLQKRLCELSVERLCRLFHLLRPFISTTSFSEKYRIKLFFVKLLILAAFASNVRLKDLASLKEWYDSLLSKAYSLSQRRKLQMLNKVRCILEAAQKDIKDNHLKAYDLLCTNLLELSDDLLNEARDVNL